MEALACCEIREEEDSRGQRVAGMGIHVFVYVDDWLIVGDDAAATRPSARNA